MFANALAVTIRPPFGERAKAATARSISPGSHADRVDLHPVRWRRGLNDAELAGAGRYGRIAKDGDARHVWRDLFEQLEPFSADAVFEVHEARRVAASPRQGLDVAGADRGRRQPGTRPAWCGWPAA